MVTGGGATTDSDAAGDIFAEVPGGAALIRHFGRIPDFDGDTILKFVLDRDRYSTLHVHARVAAGDVDGVPSPERHAAVVFVLSEIGHLRLDEFHTSSRIGRLTLRHALDHPGRTQRTGPHPAVGDVEIELVPRPGNGPSGLIRARSVEIEFEPGIPDRGFRYADEIWLPGRIRSALTDAWDPLGMGAMGLGSAYDRYVPEFVDMVRDATVSEDALVAHLARIEVEEIGLTIPPAKRVRGARALLGLRDARRPGAGGLIKQWSSPDGSLCVRIILTRDGQYAHEQRIYRTDENGERSRWEDVGTGRSGLFATFEAAEREARHLVGWLGGSTQPPSP